MSLIYFRNQTLNAESPLWLLAQYAIERYYWAPFCTPQDPNAADAKKIFRGLHGGFHVTCTQKLIHALIGFIKHYRVETLYDQVLKLEENPQRLKLLYLAAIYHDAANETDKDNTFVPESAHAKIFEKDMLNFGFDDELVSFMAHVMRVKNETQKEATGIPASLEKCLLQTADATEVRRARSPTHYHIDQTDLYAYLDVATQKHFELFSHRYQTFLQIIKATFVHSKVDLEPYEFSENVSEAVDALFRSCCTYAAQTKHLMNHPKLNLIFEPTDDVIETPMTHYLLDTVPADFVRIKHSSPPNHKISLDPLPEHFGVRVISGYLIEEELDTLKKNKALCKAHVNDSSLDSVAWRAEIVQAIDLGHIPGFKFRPLSLAKRNTPIKFFDTFGAIALMIDLNHIDTHVFAAYKRNAASHRLSARPSLFNFNEPTSGNKNLIAADANRMLETLDKQHKGLIGTRLSKHTFSHMLPINEALTTYAHEAIFGVIVSRSAESARQALWVRHVCPWISFYSYSSDDQYTPLALDSVLSFAKSTHTHPALWHTTLETMLQPQPKTDYFALLAALSKELKHGTVKTINLSHTDTGCKITTLFKGIRIETAYVEARGWIHECYDGETLAATRLSCSLYLELVRAYYEHVLKHINNHLMQHYYKTHMSHLAYTLKLVPPKSGRTFYTLTLVVDNVSAHINRQQGDSLARASIVKKFNTHPSLRRFFNTGTLHETVIGHSVTETCSNIPIAKLPLLVNHLFKDIGLDIDYEQARVESHQTESTLTI